MTALNLQPQTLATLRQLDEASWFTNVGVKDSHLVTVVSSWEEAMQRCASAEWENLCLEAVNQYRERLAEKDIHRLAQWNDLVAAVKQVILPMVERKIAAVVRVNSLPQVFGDTVQWDMLHVCMEAEYAEVFPPGFYASQAYWYLKGHFPCGWDGDFPNGKLVVF